MTAFCVSAGCDVPVRHEINWVIGPLGILNFGECQFSLKNRNREDTGSCR